MNRRQAIGFVGFGLTAAAFDNPLLTLIRSLFQGQLHDALAGSSEVELKKNYFLIFNAGAPPSWQFDLFLNPYNQPGFIAHPYVKTVLHAEKGRLLCKNGEYKLVDVDGIKVPPLWLESYYNGREQAAYTNLLQNMLTVQGVHVAARGHMAASQQLQNPVSWSESLGSLQYRNAQSLLPPISLDHDFSDFGKTAGIDRINLLTNDAEDMLAKILRPFHCGGGQLHQNMNVSFLAALQEFNTVSLAGEKGGAQHLMRSLNNALELSKDCIADIDKQWENLRGKYKVIIDHAVGQRIAGVNDLPIGYGGRKRDEHYKYYKYHVAHNKDMRTVIDSNSRLENLAERFAVAEYLLKNDLTSYLQITARNFQDIKIVDQTGYAHRYSLSNDQHNSGFYVSQMANHLYFRALGASIHELIQTLKATPGPAGYKNMFAKTLIQHSGEFNRNSANKEGGASHHGYQAQSAFFYTESIQGPMIIGRTINEASYMKENSLGTWGHGAPLRELDNQVAKSENLAATDCVLLGMDRPDLRAASLVSLDKKTGVVASKIGRAELLEVEKSEKKLS